MLSKLKKGMAMVAFLFIILLIPSVCGLAAGDAYTPHSFWGKEPKEAIAGDYRITTDGNYHISLTKGKKTIKDNISCYWGSILYGSRDFYYVDQATKNNGFPSSKAVVCRMDYSGKQKKIAVFSKLKGPLRLGGEYKNQIYCYNGGTIYRISVNSGTVKQIYAGKKYIERDGWIDGDGVTSGKYLFFRSGDDGSMYDEAGKSDLILVDMASGKASIVVKNSVDRLWKDKDTVYISTTTTSKSGRISSSTVKKFNTKSKKFVKETQVKKARVFFANDQIIVTEKIAEAGWEFYLTLRKSGKEIDLSNDYWDPPVIIGNNCYYITYDSNTIWKLSLKTGKKTKVKTVKGGFLRFNGNRASYWDANKRYVYITLK